MSVPFIQISVKEYYGCFTLFDTTLFMDESKSTWGWIVGLIVIVLVVAGLWWYFGGTVPGQSGTATTTPNGAATTTQNSRVTSETRSGSSVAAVVASLGDGSTFNSLFVNTGVAASLTGRGPYTVFVPVNNAFNNVTQGTISGISTAEKKRLVQYHVVSGKMLDVDAVSSGRHTALSKDEINFNVVLDQGTAFVNSGLVIKQYKASNGIVYLIGAVLVPPVTP